jgi:hypothetical protein
MDIKELHTRFIHEQDSHEAMREIRQTLYNLAVLINILLMDGREKSMVITKLEEALFWAYASINRKKIE